MVLSIIGCGWFGLHFAKDLIRQGHYVKGSTTSTGKLPLLENENIEPFLIDLSNSNQQLPDPSFFRCDVLVITIPPKVRANLQNTYISTIQSLIDLVKLHHVRDVLYISSTGVYGDSNNDVDETTIPTPDSLSGKVSLEAEYLFKSEALFRTTIIRFGGLIGPGRDPANFFSGKKNIPNGQAPVNLIHLEDCCGICSAIIKKRAFGYVINACAPEHPKKMDFYLRACIRKGVPEPEFIDELLVWKIVNSIYVQPLLSYSFSRSLVELKL
ncbi:MAG: NAD(P)-dependent oxidoreductase [Marivirga sp.]|nr:NAD(P)-dependent oxidoreductase [Marivirga sp.]